MIINIDYNIVYNPTINKKKVNYYSNNNFLIPKNNFKVISNPVDISYFRKFNRSKKIRNNILIIKNYESYKYAGDTTIDYLLKFSKMKLFNNFKFTLIGKGPILEKRIQFYL